MTVKRYETYTSFDDFKSRMVEEKLGTYVTYSDYQKLAAENAALKLFGSKLDEMHNDLNGEGTGIQGKAEIACQQVALEAAMEEFDAIQTPATDEFTAELRAQGVDEFAKHCKQKAEVRSYNFFTDAGNTAEEFAANLRAGRKG